MSGDSGLALSALRLGLGPLGGDCPMLLLSVLLLLSCLLLGRNIVHDSGNLEELWLIEFP